MQLLLRVAALLAVVESAKVAVFILELSNSQILFNKRVAQTLAEGGHDVTLINIKPYKGLKSNVEKDGKLKEFIVDAAGNLTLREMEEAQGGMIFSEFSWFDKKSFATMSVMSQMMAEACEKTILSQELFDFLAKEKFDVVYSHMYDYCAIGVIHKANIKSWIWLNSGGLMEYVGMSVGVPYFSSFMPPRGMDAGAKMTFLERTKSLIGHNLFKIFYNRAIPAKQTALFRKHFGEDFPDLYHDLGPKCPLVMVNSNELYEQATPTLHKVINIGGLGMQFKDAKPLPQEYDELLSTTKGIFIMSFGSVANATMMPRSWKESLMAAFAEFPEYHFVMRYAADDIESIRPKNVKLTKWIPQADLLKHPKTIGFITHGGYNSYQETILAGKPMIAIALFGDQYRNGRMAEQLGFGLMCDKNSLAKGPEKLTEAIRQLISDKSYEQAAQQLSKMAAKKPIKQEELLNKWTEFLAEFKANVLALLALIVFTVLFLLYRLVRCIVCCICCRRNRSEKPKSE
ncbi:unnamed protein product, partial [Mesorhabditis spiculigera]